MKTFFLTLTLILSFWTSTVHANPEGYIAPWNMNEEEWKASHWEVQREVHQPGSPLCGLAAMTLGVIWHGLGHYCIDDDTSMWRLTWMQSMGIALFTTGWIIDMLSNHSEAFIPTSETLMYFGSMLLISSYALDVIGSVKGNAHPFFENQREIKGMAPILITRWVPDDIMEIGWIIGIEVPMASERFYFNPKTLIDPDWHFWQVGQESAFKIWHASSNKSYGALGLETRYESYPQDHMKIMLLAPYASFSWDAGSLFPHLASLLISFKLEYGYEFYHWDAFEHEDWKFEDKMGILILESEWSLNLTENSHFSVFYQKRPDLLIGGLYDNMGIFGVRLQFLQSPWLIRLQGNFGNLTEFWLLTGLVWGQST